MRVSVGLALAGLLTSGIGYLAIYRLMPKLRSRELRGEITTPVPDPMEDRMAAFRLLSLVWSLRTSSERPRFRRHVMLVRWTPIVSISLMLASVIAMQTESGQATAVRPGVPPPVTLSVSGELEPDGR